MAVIRQAQIYAVHEVLRLAVERRYAAEANGYYDDRPDRWGTGPVPAHWPFARDLGKPPRVVLDSMTGNPTLNTLLEMCEVLGIRTSELFAMAEKLAGGAE